MSRIRNQITQNPTPNNMDDPNAARKRKRSSVSTSTTSSHPPTFLRLIDLLNSLDELIPLGTLNIQMPRRGMAGIPAPDSWLWLEPAARAATTPMTSTLESLVERGYLRTTYAMLDEKTARLRIYALPEDVSKGLVREMDGTLRRGFRKILEGLDLSDMGWQGGAVQDGQERRITMTGPTGTGLREVAGPVGVYYVDVRENKVYLDGKGAEEARRGRYSLRQKVGARIGAVADTLGLRTGGSDGDTMVTDD